VPRWRDHAKFLLANPQLLEIFYAFDKEYIREMNQVNMAIGGIR